MDPTPVDTEVLLSALRVACRAPSLHNSQPWHWVIDDRAVALFLDKSRVVYSTDHSGREALLSCGAVLDHFRVAMAAAGWTAHVDRYPNPNNRLHLATFTFTPLPFVTEGHRRRADAILDRRTDRLPFAAPTDWESVEHHLRRNNESDIVHFDVVADELRPELAQASKLTEYLRLYDSSYHEELSWWTAPYGSTEGIPRDLLPTAAERERVDIARDFPTTTSDRDRRHSYGRDQSKIAVLSTPDDDPLSVLRCGETLSAVLLDATMAGLATCTLTHMTELHASRDIVASLIDTSAVPQVLIRMGRAPAMEQTPTTARRPLAEVVENRRSSNGSKAAAASPS
ncbi:Acg family FMN-binding oxidoreductase [Mycolicibacterium phlei]